MKIIALSKIGYNHPSQANWNYGIWKLDLIDTDKPYNMSHTLKETFGGDDRFKAKVENELHITILETKGVHTNTGTPNITGVRNLPDIESKEVFEIIKDFINAE